MLSCAVRRLSAQEWRDATVPVHEPVLVTAPLTIQPVAALDLLRNLTVGVLSSSAVDSLLYSQFGRPADSLAAEPMEFGSFAAGTRTEAMVFSLGDADNAARRIEAVMPPQLAAQAGLALERSRLSEGTACGATCAAEEAPQWQAWRTPLVSASGRRAGLRLHQHGAAWLYLLTGAKQWWLAHPESALLGEEAVALASVADEAATLCSIEQWPGELLFVPPMWFHATRNTAEGITIGVGAQTVLSSLPRDAALAEVAALHRAYPKAARLEAYHLEGIEQPTAATVDRLSALVRQEPWHLPVRLTLLRHAVEASHFDAAVDAAAALAELVQQLVLRRAAMAPLDAHFVLSRGAATLYDAARERLAGGVDTKPLFLTTARLHNTARQLLVGNGSGLSDVTGLPRPSRAAWVESVWVMGSSSYAAGAYEASLACVRALRSLPPDARDDLASSAAEFAEKLRRALDSRAG